MRSALYHGCVRHRRFAERERSFRHRLAMAYVDLDELPQLGLESPWRLVRFDRSDYWSADAVRERVGTDGPVRVLTQLRSIGRSFNPVSFYYCFDRDERLQALLAEVTNTPWGERQSYVLTRGGSTGSVLRGESEKLMHVSPFFGMDQRYRWSVGEPRETLAVHIENHEAGRVAFDATLSLEREDLSRTALARQLFAGWRTLALIYGHAAAIRLRGIRTRPHPARAAG